MEFTDQLHRKINLDSAPLRIISLVPSQTELLCDLDLEDRVVGITKFCIHPDSWFRTKPRVGGTKHYDFAKIAALQPDLIIGNKEENDKEQIEALMKLYPVWMSDICNLKDALAMIVMLGALLERSEKAINIKLEIAARFQHLQTQVAASAKPPVRTAYFIWRKPYMVAGGTTFINEMLTICGFDNVFTGRSHERYPEISEDQLRDAKPDIIFLSSEPYPFREAHIAEFRAICPEAKVLTVDGEMFSWYGSRLLKAPQYFLGLIQDLV